MPVMPPNCRLRAWVFTATCFAVADFVPYVLNLPTIQSLSVTLTKLLGGFFTKDLLTVTSLAPHPKIYRGNVSTKCIQQRKKVLRKISIGLHSVADVAFVDSVKG